MTYDYIRNNYGIEITVDRLVRHIVTGRGGDCQPGELEFVAHDE